MQYNISKRKFLVSFLAALLSFLGSIKFVYSKGSPYRDRFQSYRQTFRVEPDLEEAKRTINNIIEGRKLDDNLLTISVPDIAEDGNVVPVSFIINCSMKNKDYPEKVHVLAMENPFPEIAVFNFTPNCGEAEVSFRCRMRASADLVIIAEMRDGRIGMKKQYVEVMLGACS